MLSSKDISYFRSVCGDTFVLNDENSLKTHSYDETEDLRFLPWVVVKPANTAEASSVLKYCNQHKIPVTPQGARTGLSGGALASKED